MPFYHVTFDRHIPSILKHGLGGRVVEQNFPGCEPGVYLGTNHDLAILMLMERAFEAADDNMSPKDWVASVRVIVIDDSRIDPTRLTHDESFPDSTVIRRYVGVIDVVSMPILTLDQAIPPEYRPGGAKYREMEADLAEDIRRFESE